MRFPRLILATTLSFAAAYPTMAESPPVATSAQAEKPTLKQWQAVVDKATEHLSKSQDENGGWSTKQSVGITGIVVTGLLECGKNADDEPCAKGLKYIESLVNPKAGHIAGSDPKIGLQNYVTSINIMALNAAGRGDKYKQTIGNGVKFLKKLQWDDEEGAKQADDNFGGAGYDSKSRPDLSNTQFFVEALKAGGVGSNDPAMKHALVFISRCQNYDSEHNDRPWAKKLNDGSFIYSAAAGGQTKTSDKPDAPLNGYGSMTYAGVKSMIYCGVGKDDPRIKKALEWLRANYTVEMNPGMPKELGDRGRFYYYHTMAKALDLLGEDEFVDAKGVKHDWRADILAKLMSEQQQNGSFLNKTDRWMEGDPNLVTGYVLMTLSHCKPKK